MEAPLGISATASSTLEKTLSTCLSPCGTSNLPPAGALISFADSYSQAILPLILQGDIINAIMEADYQIVKKVQLCNRAKKHWKY